DTETLLQPPNQFVDRIRNNWVEPRGWFVIKNARRLADDRAREADTLFHAAAQVHRHFFFLPLQLHYFEHLSDLFAQNVRIALASFAQRKGDVFRDRHRIEKRAALKKNSDLLANRRELALVHFDNV